MSSRSSLRPLSLLLLPLALFSAAGCEGSEAPSADPAAKAAPTAPVAPAAVKVLVHAGGYEPDRVEVQAGQEVKLTFVRTTDEGCGEKLVFPEQKIEKELPLNEPVTVSLTPKKDETIGFTCGMGMYKGSVVATL